ncbi:MAG: ThiF family adenylyltransferase [Flavobacteriales bacterium]
MKTLNHILLNRKTKTDEIKYQQILKKNKPILFNQIKIQLKDYIKLKHPQQELTPKEYNQKIKEKLKGTTLEKYGNWVYYPWTNRFVHILPEDEFKTVRTIRNRYKITAQEEETLSTKKVGIIGLSVGQSVALALAMERIGGEIRIADFDTLELSNLNRIRTGIHNLGLAKTTVVVREIAEIDPYIKVTCFNEGITENNLNEFIGTNKKKLDLLIDECDSIDIKFRCREAAKKEQIPVLMDTSDRGMLDIERFDLEPERALFHGLIDKSMNNSIKKGLNTKQKFEIVSAILDMQNISNRMSESFTEIGKTITTWPQLASSVILGGAITAIVGRKILLGEKIKSGRYYVDVDKIIDRV